VARNSGVSRLEGSGLLVFFAAWLIAKIWRAVGWTAKEEPAPANVAERSGWLALSFCFVGVLLLASTGRLIVYGIEGLAATFNLNYFALGATLVPLCTTVPELTSVFAIRYRSPDGVSTKMLLENSLLNAWLLGGLAAVIAPYRITPVAVAVTAAVAAGLALLAWPTLRVPPRARGAVLLAVYSGFLYYMI
jgi:cation:H+ antiporter